MKSVKIKPKSSMRYEIIGTKAQFRHPLQPTSWALQLLNSSPIVDPHAVHLRGAQRI